MNICSPIRPSKLHWETRSLWSIEKDWSPSRIKLHPHTQWIHIYFIIFRKYQFSCGSLKIFSHIELNCGAYNDWWPLLQCNPKACYNRQGLSCWKTVSLSGLFFLNCSFHFLNNTSTSQLPPSLSLQPDTSRRRQACINKGQLMSLTQKGRLT